MKYPPHHGVERNKLLLFFKTSDREQMHFSWYRDNKNKRSSSQKLLIIVWGKTLIFHLFMMSDLLNALCRSSCFSVDSSCRCCSAKDYSPKKTFLNQTSRQQMLSFNESLETSILWNTQTHSHLCINTQPLQKYTSTSYSNKQRYPVT